MMLVTLCDLRDKFSLYWTTPLHARLSTMGPTDMNILLGIPSDAPTLPSDAPTLPSDPPALPDKGNTAWNGLNQVPRPA